MESFFRISLVDFVNIVFSLGLFLNAALFIPQALRIYRTKNAEGISLVTFVGFHIMQIFTVWHGYLVEDYALMVGFLLSFFTCGMVTCLALKYRKPKTTKTAHFLNKDGLEAI
ncbi:MAG TPA: PQ-loop domain-containing transporter [Gammaproteobacteria bacterium]|nr:PQ-loop domain-containing transporter [Gammaproteobacteria bacterium]